MNLIHKLIKRYMAWTGLTLHITPEQEEEEENRIALNLNVAHSASDSEVNELEEQLGGKKDAAEGTGVDTEEEDLLAAAGGDDEGTSGAKRSEAELDAATDSERQAIREHKRQSRLNQQQRAREKIASLERQLANALAREQTINQRVGNLETNNLGNQAAQLEQAAQEAASAETYWKNIIADATHKGEGEKTADAMVALVEIQRRKELIQQARQNLQQARQAPPQQRPANPQVAEHVNTFMRDNPWYKPRSNDIDSAALSALDSVLSKEGWDPSSATYWAELKARAMAYSPSLAKRFGGQQTQAIDKGKSEGNSYNAASNPTRPQRSPVAGSNGSNNPGGGENSTRYTLSPQRVQAMKEAGLWDDPKQRQDMVKRYQAMDRELAADRRT